MLLAEVTVLQAGTQTATVTPAFTDVPDAHPNAIAINYLREQGFVTGKPDGTFRPDDLINRAEFVALLIRPVADAAVQQTCLEGLMQAPFRDVIGNEWFMGPVCVAWQNGFVTGYPEDQTFRGTNTINFAEAAHIISRIYDIRPSKPPVGTAWYAPAVAAMVENTIVPAGITNVNQQITRDQMAGMMYRVIRTGSAPVAYVPYGTTTPSQSTDIPVHGAAPAVTGTPTGASQPQSTTMQPRAYIEQIRTQILNRVTAVKEIAQEQRGLRPTSGLKTQSVSSTGNTQAGGTTTVITISNPATTSEQGMSVSTQQQQIPTAPVAEQPAVPLIPDEAATFNPPPHNPGACHGAQIWHGGVSDDGDILFMASFDNLVDNGAYGGLFLRQRENGVLRRVTAWATSARMSPDSRYIAYHGSYPDGEPHTGGWLGTRGNTRGAGDGPAYAYDTVTNTKITAPRTLPFPAYKNDYAQWTAAPDNLGCRHWRQSPNGRFIACGTYDAMLPEDKNGRQDVYLYDTITKKLELASRRDDGQIGTCSWDNGDPTLIEGGVAVDGGVPFRPTCGNGTVERGEMCDNGSGNSDEKPDTCRTVCLKAFCGDSICDADEQTWNCPKDCSENGMHYCPFEACDGERPSCSEDEHNYAVCARPMREYGMQCTWAPLCLDKATSEPMNDAVRLGTLPPWKR